jgi:hypothetical protein
MEMAVISEPKSGRRGFPPELHVFEGRNDLIAEH